MQKHLFRLNSLAQDYVMKSFKSIFHVFQAHIMYELKISRSPYFHGQYYYHKNDYDKPYQKIFLKFEFLLTIQLQMLHIRLACLAVRLGWV